MYTLLYAKNSNYTPVRCKKAMPKIFGITYTELCTLAPLTPGLQGLAAFLFER